jgi:shikimate kinase
VADEDHEGEDADAMYLSEAIAVFQRKAGLEVTGTLDDKTREALLERHGS